MHLGPFLINNDNDADLDGSYSRLWINFIGGVMEQMVAHQLGMAMALCSLGAEMSQKHEPALLEYVTEDELEGERQTFEDHARRSEEIANELNLGDQARQSFAGADRTFREIHDTFFETMPQDSPHVLNWLTMSHAGGIAIWSVLAGAAESMNNAKLRELSNEALAFQKQSLGKAENILMQIGKKAVRV